MFRGTPCSYSNVKEDFQVFFQMLKCSAKALFRKTVYIVYYTETEVWGLYNCGIGRGLLD